MQHVEALRRKRVASHMIASRVEHDLCVLEKLLFRHRLRQLHPVLKPQGAHLLCVARSKALAETATLMADQGGNGLAGTPRNESGNCTRYVHLAPQIGKDSDSRKGQILGRACAHLAKCGVVSEGMKANIERLS